MKMSIGSIQGVQESIPKVYIQHLALPACRFLGIVAVLILGGNILGIAWAYALSYAVAAFLGLYFVATRTPLFSWGLPYESSHRQLLSFSAPLIVSSAMALIFADMDMFMIGIFRNTAEVGVYNVVYPLAQLLLVALSGFKFLFMPVLSELHSQGEQNRMKRTYEVVTKWIALATFPLFIVTILFPVTLISITFGVKYASGAVALAVLATGFFSHVLAGFNGATLTSIGRTRQIMYANTATAAINIILNLMLIPRYGVLGAAIATAVAYLTLNVILSYQLHKLSGIHPFSMSLVRPLAAGIGITAFCYGGVVIFVESSPFRLLAFLIVFGSAYPITVLRLGGVEKEEVMLVLSFEERFGVDLGPFKRVAKRLMD
jgi:O-antigen/teichoic acid export membrane protein